MICLSCAQGFHEECGSPCCCPTNPAVDKEDTTGKRDGMKWSKDDSDIRDLKSTGRKRAAILYPLDRNADCEWRGLRFAGGGLFPIPGCITGTQHHRHHGPIVLTTSNISGNVHRICTDCHNRWHGLNDAFIKEFMTTILWSPHDPDTELAPEEVVEVVKFGHTEYARRRMAPRKYDKSTDDYTELLESLKERGVSIVNEYLGI